MTRVIKPPPPGPGRPPGLQNKSTREMKEFARSVTLESEEYRASILKRMRNDTLHPSIELFLLASGYGKPKENIKVEVNVSHDVSDLTLPELAERARLIAAQIEDPSILDAEVIAEKIAI